jgi:hypothetical protein
MISRSTFQITLLLLSSCNTPDNLREHKDPRDTIIRNSSLRPVQKLLTLDHGFYAEFSDKIGSDATEQYKYMRLSRNTGMVMVDSVHNYVIEEKMYPMVIPKKEDRFEILMEIKNDPEQNHLQWIFVDGDQLMNTGILPLFISGKFDINRDGRSELAGFTHFTETLTRDGTQFTVYNPLLFYGITDNGLKLDSGLTREVNTRIYGEFRGFLYDKNAEFPVDATKRFDEEVRRIKMLGSAR